MNITMPSKKIKISELPLVESLKGLYTIGYKIIDGIKTSVKVSLEDIQTAYQDVVNAVKNSEVATKNANTAASNANEKAVLADAAAANANDTAEHPTYIGQDHYVYRWNKTAQAYDKTDIYTKGDAFSIKKVYASVANMEADKSNPDITEGDFVLVNTGDVEDPDNAKLYVKADGDFEFLVDMSGAIGFTGKTPQFSIGTISTLEAGSTATATISEDGVDSDGNPKYKINFAIPRGNPGAPFRIAGEYATLEALKSAVPDGSAVDGFMAVGTEAPYDYYAWVNGDWVNQGKIAGGGSGNVVVIPAAAMSLSDQATSDEIFNAFGGKDAFMDICQSIVNKDTVCVVANIPEESGMKLVYIPVMAMATYTDANNANFMMAIITETTFQLVVTVTDGVATQSSQVLNHIYEAPSDGNVYGRKNKDWVEVPEKSDVLTKNNETEYTPTGDYQPATKKYVDNTAYGKFIDVADGSLLTINKNIQGTEAYDYIVKMFGSTNVIKNTVIDICNNHTKYYIHSYSSPKNCIELSSVYCYYTDTERYEIQFNISYYITSKPVSKRIAIALDLSDDIDKSDDRLSIEDILVSDNLAAITKKTSAEYEGIGSKDANTAYCVTD